MLLFLNAVPLFPFLDHTNIAKIITEDENKSLFDRILIEFLYRTVLEIILFDTLWRFKSQINKSKPRILIERFGISLGLILWNYIGFSKVFQTDDFSVYTSFSKAKLYYPLIDLLHGWFNLYIIFVILKSTIIASQITFADPDVNNKTGLVVDYQKFFHIYPLTLLLKYLIDGSLITSSVSKDFLVDYDSRVYSLSGFLIRVSINVKWIADGIQTLESPLSGIVLVLLASLTLSCAFFLIRYHAFIRIFLKAVLFEAWKYKFLIIPFGLNGITTYINWCSFDKPLYDDGSSFILNLLLNTLLDKRTFIMGCIFEHIYSNLKNNDDNMTILYLLYGYKEVVTEINEDGLNNYRSTLTLAENYKSYV